MSIVYCTCIVMLIMALIMKKKIRWVKKKNIRNFNIRKNMTSYTQVVSLLIVITRVVESEDFLGFRLRLPTPTPEIIYIYIIWESHLNERKWFSFFLYCQRPCLYYESKWGEFHLCIISINFGGGKCSNNAISLYNYY